MTTTQRNNKQPKTASNSNEKKANPVRKKPLTAAPKALTVLDKKGFYKPFNYPWAFEAYRMQAVDMNWTVSEVVMAEDVKDWNFKLSDAERNLLTQLFRFFTTSDVDIGQAYLDKFIPVFKNEEIRMMLTEFAATESLHVDAYSTLLDTVGMPEVEYQMFRKYQAMVAKHEYLMEFDTDTPTGIARSLAVYSAFTEGLQLFSTFAILMNFARGDLPRGARMKGMNQYIAWSIRDETHHVQNMAKLFRVFIHEHPEVWTKSLQDELYDICRKMVELEDAFIDLAFEQGGIEGLSPEEVKQYIRYIADRRLQGLMLNPIYLVPSNPLMWLDYLMSGVEHTNFFENRSTAYSRGLSGSWAEDVWGSAKAVAN